MPYQLTIKKDGKTSAEIFARATCREFDQEIVTIGDESCDCPVPGTTGALVTLRSVGKAVQIMSCNEGVLANGRVPAVGDSLNSGAVLLVNGYAIRFQQLRERAKVSRSSVLLAKSARTIVGVCLVCELLLMLVVPEIMQRGSFWSGQIKRLEIVKSVDNLEDELEKFTPHDPVRQALTLTIASELLSCKRYLRDNAADLAPSQRRAMLNNLEQWQKTIAWLKETDQILPPLPELDFDNSVKNIIRNTVEGQEDGE